MMHDHMLLKTFNRSMFNYATQKPSHE